MPTVIWCTVYVPGVTCGKQWYNTSFILTPAGGQPISINVGLYVFNVLLDIQPHLATNGESQPKFKVTGAGETSFL